MLSNGDVLIQTCITFWLNARQQAATISQLYLLNFLYLLNLFKTNGYKLVLPSGGPSGKYTKY